LPRHISQKQAALEAVEKIGLNQIKEIDYDWFGDRVEIKDMFKNMLRTLKYRELC